MLFDLLVVSAAVLLNGGTAAAASSSKPTASACSSVSSMSSAFMSAYPSATAALVPAAEAEACLRSVPVDVDEDVALIEEMQYFVNWQSNLAYHSDPPKGYTEGKLDVLGEMKNISDTLKKGGYDDEFSVMHDLYMVMVKSYDFHFVFMPDIMMVFLFRRGNIGRGLSDEFALVSVSSDGKSAPELYNYYDIYYPGSGWTASPVVQINNQSAEDFVQSWANGFDYHEDHARYNRLFPNQPSGSTGQKINQLGRTRTPIGGDDYTVVQYKNGTTGKYMNNAVIPKDLMDGIETGEDFFEAFCNLGPPKQSSSSKSRRNALLDDSIEVRKRGITPVKKADTDLVARASASASAAPTATGYPKPEILHSEAVIGGYYLSDKGYEDVAVLSIPSFSPETDDGPAEFQDLIGNFLQTAAKAGKKKLIIDLRGNGGGRVYLGYDAFKQIFPNMDPYGASQFRANEAFQEIGKIFNEALDEHTYQEAIKDFQENGDDGYGAQWTSIFNYRVPVTVNNKNFTSWDDYYGPHDIHNDKFSTVSRKDLTNFFSDDLSLDVTGYRTRASKLNTNQPFEAKNIVMLQDGGCGSTCAVFSEFMKNQGGVQQIVVGGKPGTGPMQGVSGSKGSQVFSWDQIYSQAQIVYKAMPDKQEELNKTDVGEILFGKRARYRTAYQTSGQAFSSINLRDNIRMNDSTTTPLEFLYEAADCRLFYTAEMIRDPTPLWKKTVDAHFGDAKSVCVENSTGDKSSLSGGAPTASNTNNKGNGNSDKKNNANGAVDVSKMVVGALVGVVSVFAML